MERYILYILYIYVIKCKTLSHLCSIFLSHWLNQYTHIIMKYTRCRNVKLWKLYPIVRKKTHYIKMSRNMVYGQRSNRTMSVVSSYKIELDEALKTIILHVCRYMYKCINLLVKAQYIAQKTF